MTDRRVEPPPLDAVDVYLYAFGNGAIYRYDADRRSGFATLAEALEIAEACGAVGGRVLLGRDPGELADRTCEAVRATGVPIVDYEPPLPPYLWDNGGDALMVAAAYEQHDLLDDLIDRGADVNARNHQNATALHHAAAAGNVHAVERLLAAGADPDVRNDAGLTALMAAQACREHEAAMLLEAAGATPSHVEGEVVRFRGSHRIPFWGGALTGACYAVFALAAVGSQVGLVAGLAAFVVVLAVGVRLGQPLAVWRGMAPTSFDGRRLRGTSAFGRPREVDLDEVTQAVYGGGGGRYGRLVGSHLVLVHPGGRPVTTKQVRRVVSAAGQPELVPDGAKVTVVVMDPWWDHEVLRPVGNRLISDPVELSPTLRGRLQDARGEDPTVSRSRSGARARRSG